MTVVTVNSWGNSNGIRLPKSVLEELNIGLHDELQLHILNGDIVLKKNFKHKSFEERLKEYDGQISVCSFEWGDPAGKELL